jgi:hypothetical protein
MKTNVSEKMKEILPLLRNGFGGIETPGLYPECKEEWNEGYAIVCGLYYHFEEDNEYVFFDDHKFKTDYEASVREHFPDCKVNFYWESGEIEVIRN